ncbi:MAG: phage late control D family protein, partial [Myxococcales bacterium]|nr:phage late control D family protein [Myxococcales bacterium]
MTPTLDPPDALPEIHCDVTWRSTARVPLRAPWYVRRLELVEHLDAPFLLRLQIDSDELDLDVLDLVGGELTVTLAREGSSMRRIHGVVLRSELLGPFAARVELSLDVGPAVALAGLGARTRIFQHMSVPEIVAAVLGPTLAPLRRGVEVRLSRSHPARDVVVQWRESDLDFVLRILADAAIGCVFEHGAEVEAMVLIDDVARLRGVGNDDDGDPGPTTVRLLADDGTPPPVERVAVLAPARSATPSRFDALGWDWKQRPPTLLESTERIATAAWPAAVLEDTGTRRLLELDAPAHADETGAHARGAKAEAAAAAAKAAGWGDVLSFTPGRT